MARRVNRRRTARDMRAVEVEIDGVGDPSETVYSGISDAILARRLRPGTKLGEQALSEIFGVNRPVIRRALMRLSYESLVEIRPHRGAYVASPTPEEARQVFEARRIVEEWAARTAADRATGEMLDRLRKHVEIETAAARTGDRVRWIRLSGEFHILLARATGNERIVRYLQDLVAQTSLIISLYGTGNESDCSEDEHSRIIEALLERNGDRAVACMRDHLVACETALAFRDEQESQDLRAIFAALRKEDRPRRAAVRSTG